MAAETKLINWRQLGGPCQLMAGGCLPEVVALFGFERGA